MNAGFIYVWFNKVNNKMYIGSHKGSKDDGYIGSGLYFKRAYNLNPNNFERYILEYHKGSYKELLELESMYLKKYDVKNNKMFYNLIDNAINCGSVLHDHLSDYEKSVIYKKWLNGSIKWFKNATPEQLSDLKYRKQESWKRSSKLKKHSENTSKRRILEELNKTEEQKVLFSDHCRSSYWNRTEDEIKDHLNKQSEGVKKWHSEMSNDKKIQRANKQKETKKKKRGRHINKNGQGKCVPSAELSDWLNSGWSLGMVKKINPV